MPLILHEKTQDRELAIWEITEDEASLEALVTADDLRSARSINSPSRRREHLAARAALRTVLPGGVVYYYEDGAPYLGNPDGAPDDNTHLSFSHCRGAAAVIVSARPCAVDIEVTERDFTRAAPRFISEEETELEGSDGQGFRAAVWCAKETLYKLARRPGTDFLADMALSSVDLAGGRITARVHERHGIELAVRNVGAFTLCYTPI